MNTRSLWQEASESLDLLFAAHAAALGELKNAPRTCVSHFAKKGADGKPIPDYADLATVLDTVRTALSKNGLSVTQSFMPFGDDGTTMVLVTTMGHKSGQFQRSYVPMKCNVAPQQMAATATYLKRMALCALVGVAADDDDNGEQAEKGHVTAAVNDESRIVLALQKKVKAAKGHDARWAEVSRAEKGLREGAISKKGYDAIVEVAEALDEQEAQKAESAG